MALAAEIRLIIVDFPAFGRPTRPMSASSFSSSRTVISTAGPGGDAKSGAWRHGRAKFWLPLPGWPPWQTTYCWPGATRSPSTTPFSSKMRVPTGTFRTRSSPPRPLMRRPSPGAPSWAVCLRLKW